MARNPVMVALPPFEGVTRKLILTALALFFVLVLTRAFVPDICALLMDRLMLHPGDALGRQLWQLATYPFVDFGLLSVLLTCLSLWYFGSALEGERGARWLTEFFFTSTIGGGLLASLLSLTLFRHVPGLGPEQRADTLWAPVMALLVAYAVFHPDEELSFNFLFRVKAKYLAVIYLLVYLAIALTTAGQFDAMVVLCASLTGYVFVKFAPQRGLRFVASERWYGLRNAYYRRKRQRAAKKFTVYMKQQGRDVHFDASGRYMPDEDRDRRDRKDKRWMN